jgi:hypothetical protein
MPEAINMQAKTKRIMLNASNLLVVLGLIVMTLLTVFWIVFSWVEGQYLFSGIGIVLIYVMFMGSDVVCRRYLRHSN